MDDQKNDLLQGVEQQFRDLQRKYAELNEAAEERRASRGLRVLVYGYAESYAQWQYEHPGLARLVRILAGLCFFVLVCWMLWWVAFTSAGKVLGMDSVRWRITHAYYAAVWASRVNDANIEPMQPQRTQGTIEEVIDDVLVVSFYTDGKLRRRLAKPANVVVTSPKGLSEWAGPMLLKGLVVDFYIPVAERSGRDVWAVVIWERRVPKNVELVERGWGNPEIDPPTAVVNQIYSQYYWNLAVNGTKR